jgi:sulfatase maturation enzyme AslB (radical SAM superfamily)
LITDEIVGLLRKYNLFTIISVDGKPRTNFNGRGNYQIDEGIKKIIGAHLPFGLSVTIGKHNIDDLEQNVLYLIKKFHPTDIGLNNYLHPLRSKYSNNFEVVGRDCLNTLALIYEKIARKGIFIEPMTRRIGSIVEEIPRLKDCPACGNKIVALPEEVIGRCEYFCLHKMHLLDIETLSDSSPSSNHLWQSLSPINWK